MQSVVSSYRATLYVKMEYMVEPRWYFDLPCSKPVLDENQQELVRNLFDQLSKPVDNVSKVLNLLKSHRFDQFPEEFKYRILNYEQHNNEYVWEKVIQGDKLHTMEYLLLQTPLFAVARCNIDKHKWIKNITWARHVLYQNKVRWNASNVCKCMNHEDPSTTKEQFCALTELASAAFAAELFCRGCKYNAMKCMRYLYSQCPALLDTKLKLPTYDSLPHCLVSPLLVALLEGSDIIQILLTSKPPVKVICIALELLYLSPVDMTTSIERTIEMLVRDREDEIKSWRSYGCTVMHKLFKLAWCLSLHCRTKKLVFFTKFFLSIGLDPRDKVTDTFFPFYDTEHIWSAFDILVNFQLSMHGHFLPHFYSNRAIESTSSILQNLVRCSEIILPYFSDTIQGQITLPQLSKSGYSSLETLHLDYIKTAQVFLNTEVFDVDVENTLITWFNNGFLACTKSYPCRLCEPVIKYIYTSMCNGLDLQKQAYDADFSHHKTLPDAIGTNLPRFSHNDTLCQCQNPIPGVPKRLSTCDCCTWALFELVIHCGASITDMMVNADCACYEQRTHSITALLAYDKAPIDAASQGINLYNINQAITLVWMYKPSCKRYIMEYLQKLCNDLTNFDDDQDIVNNLQELLQQVRPLTLLCRLEVLNYIQWKDIQKLNIHRHLQKYLQFGDISASHIIHNLI